MRIFIDPGHGGDDPGAIGCGHLEKDMNLDYSIALVMQLNKYENVECVLSRTDDSNPSLRDRTNFENGSNYDLGISCHNNSSDNIEATGTEVIYSITSSRNFINFCDSLGRSVANALGVPFRRSFSKVGDGGRDYYHMIRETLCPMIIMEGLFVSNPKDMAHWNTEVIAEAMAKEIAGFYGLVKKPEPEPVVVPSGIKYRVMAGSYSIKENADKQVAKLKSMGIDAVIMTFKEG
jgi:N-acetylmuramoyl-L-alanine amidase